MWLHRLYKELSNAKGNDTDNGKMGRLSKKFTRKQQELAGIKSERQK